jgi:biopolymer transport protein ExbD
VTLTKLQEEFTRRAAQGTNAALAIRSDKEASFDTVIKVVQAAYAANLKPQISVFVQQPGGAK